MHFKKLLTLIGIFYCTFSFSQSPDEEKNSPDYFYAEDILFAGKAYLLACKEIEENSLPKYVFDLWKGDNKRTFKMVDIYPSEKTIPIFQTQLRTILKELNPPGDVMSQGDKNHLNSIANSSTGTDISLSIEDKDFIEKLTKKVSAEYGFESVTFENSFVPLLSKLVPDDSIWLETQIEAAKIVSLTFKENQDKQLDTDASAYLINVHDADTDLLDFAPEVGILRVNKKVKIYPWGNKQNQRKRRSECEIELEKYDSLKIERVEVEFEYEQIAGIKVIGSLRKKEIRQASRNTFRSSVFPFYSVSTIRGPASSPKQSLQLVFQNRIPIAYSTKADVSNDEGAKRSELIRLFATRSLCDMNSIFIAMHEVFSNDYRLLNQTENYSPADQVLTIKPGQKGKVIKKEKVTNILQAKIFSDIVGLNDDNPNGLVQTEVSHRYFFDSRVYQINDSYMYYGFFNSAMAKAVFSKLESNNKFLDLQLTPGPKPDPMNPDRVDTLRSFVNTIDLFSHTSWSVGGEINIAYIGLPFLQSVVYFNLGTYMRRVPMRFPVLEDNTYVEPFRDKIPDPERKFHTNLISVFPELTWSVNPHPNLRFGYTAKFIRMFHFTKDFEVVSDIDNYLVSRETFDPWVINLKLLAAARTSTEANGEIFFRSYFSFIPDNPAQNFFQVQLGYSFNIFNRNNDPAPPKPLEEL